MLWASPLFNRKGEDRWTSAYQEMKNDLNTIRSCGYDLFRTASDVNGSDFALQFMQLTKNPEAVFVTLHNSITTESDEQQNNPWEAKVRPKNTAGSGLAASYTLVNLFPDKNGIIVPGTGTYKWLKPSGTYDKNYPFVDRDPRFYRTFAFPGVKWSYSGDPTKKDPNNPSYGNGKNYVLWNYVWYTDDTKREDKTGSDAARAADNFLTSRSSIYVRKKSDDGGIKGATQMYTYMAEYDQPFKTSAAPLIELRFAEVLLNLAEAACMSGDVDGALGYMNQVRTRAGVRNLTTADFQGGDNKAACMSAILYERQIEFAYEGKRFYDMRRWMLFDGGKTKPENTPDTYTLTGFWGSNTCDWLGVTEWNGQRRERIEFQTAKSYGQGGITYDSDPLLKAGVVRDVIVDLDDSNTDLSTQTANLKTWYQNNLYIVEKYSDPRDAAQNLEKITFKPKYYILGFKNNVQENNKEIPQTVGWEMSNGGSYGTFDPLAN